MGIRRIMLFCAAVVVIRCCCAFGMDYEQLQPAYEIKSYPGSSNFQKVYGFSINWKDNTVALLAGMPLSINVYNLSAGSPLRRVDVFEKLDGYMSFWSCDGTYVIWTAGGFIAYGQDGKKLEKYDPPEAVKAVKRGAAECAKQGGLLVFDYDGNRVTLTGGKGDVTYPAACGEKEKGCRNEKAAAKIGGLGDAVMDSLGALIVLDLKTGDVLKQYDYRGMFRKGVLGPQSFGSPLMEFSAPSMLALDEKGYIYIMDGGDYSLKVFDGFGYAKHVFRDNGPWGFSWRQPVGMQADRYGHLLVLDAGSSSLRVFDISRVE